jgi:hypothetical protein
MVSTRAHAGRWCGASAAVATLSMASLLCGSAHAGVIVVDASGGGQYNRDPAGRGRGGGR